MRRSTGTLGRSIKTDYCIRRSALNDALASSGGYRNFHQDSQATARRGVLDWFTLLANFPVHKRTFPAAKAYLGAAPKSISASFFSAPFCLKCPPTRHAGDPVEESRRERVCFTVASGLNAFAPLAAPTSSFPTPKLRALSSCEYPGTSLSYGEHLFDEVSD